MSLLPAQSNFRKLLFVAFGLTCTAALAIGLTIWWLRIDAIADAWKDSNNLATVLADQTANSVQAIDIVMTEIKDYEETRGRQVASDSEQILGGKATHQFLMQNLARLQQAEFISLVDKNGKLVNSTQAWPSPAIDLSVSAGDKIPQWSGRVFRLRRNNNPAAIAFCSNQRRAGDEERGVIWTGSLCGPD